MANLTQLAKGMASQG